jgi:hypothetical protein
MATKVNPAPETGTTVESGDAPAVRASTPVTVQVRWTAWKQYRGVKQSREINGSTWKTDGWQLDPDMPHPVAEVDAAWWNGLTPAQRKAESLEEVT